MTKMTTGLRSTIFRSIGHAAEDRSGAEVARQKHDRQQVGDRIAQAVRRRGHDGSEPLYEQVKRAIMRQIVSGQIKAGQRLPPLRTLCGQLGLSYVTVARGVRALTEEGVLEANTARGTRVVTRRAGLKNAIGLLGLMPLAEMLTQAPYFRSVYYKIQENLMERSQTVVCDHWKDRRPLSGMFQKMQLVDGLILLGFHRDRMGDVQEVQRLGVPVVIVGDTFADTFAVTVDSDNENDTARAVAALRKLGHRHIAFVSIRSDPGRSSTSLRVAGYERAMREGEMEQDRNWVIEEAPENWSRRLLSLRPLPTAIILNSVREFPVLLAGLAGTPLEPGKGLLVAAYDENLANIIGEHGIEHIRIDQPLDKIAAATVSCLCDMLADSSFQPTAAFIPSSIIHVLPDGSAGKL